MKKSICAAHAPKVVGPYSHAVVYNGLAFVSGQIPIDPSSGELVQGNISPQTERVLENIKIVLEEVGASLGSVLKTTVYLTDLRDFPQMNEVYSRYFPQDCPARATVQVSALPKGVRIEIDAIAAVD